MVEISATESVFKEIGTAIATAVCGHGADELSPAAKVVYQQMLDCHFKFRYHITDTGKRGLSTDKKEK
jgi:hypothetical protein